MAQFFAHTIAGLNGRRTEKQSIRQAIEELNSYSNQELDDLGLARCEITNAVTRGSMQKAGTLEVAHETYLKAIRELENYSDRELEDINLTRSDIPFAVMHGRSAVTQAS